MKRYDVLDPATPFKGSFLLEASAGTGKTFTLQHLFLKHVLAGVSPQRIAVITFTRAATRELKNRLRKGIQEALAKDPQNALLRKTLSDIDLTPIRTIHGFLGEVLNRFALEGGRPLSTTTFGALPLLEEKIGAVRDYLRSQEALNNHLPYEEELLFSIHHFELEVAQLMGPGLSQKEVRLEPTLEKLKALPWSRQLLLDLPKWFRKGKKGDGSLWCHALADVLEGQPINRLLSEGSPLKGVLEEGNRLKKAPIALWNDEVAALLREELIPLCDQLTLKKNILKKYASYIYPFYRERSQEMGPDDLLLEVSKLVDHPPFASAFRDAFDVVLVDEFQDTDPLQWKILSTLFLNTKCTLTLVGDPKQAIYRFRKADLYTYFEAKRALGEENCYQLTHNYRSHPLLIQTLNHFFGSAPLLRLPALKEEHAYIPVGAGIADYALSKPPLVLIETEDEKTLFRWIGKELRTFERGESVALLVKDRFQAGRLKKQLEEMGVETSLYKTASWEEEELLGAIQTLFKALEHPDSRSRIFHLFATPFFRDALFCRTEEEVAIAMGDLFRLRQLYLTLGAPALFEALLPLGWGGQSFGQWLIKQESFHRFQKLFVLLEQGVPSHRFSEIYDWIERLYLGIEKEESEEKPTVERGVPLIMTIHMSKGLEFDVVFVPGVMVPLSRGDEEDEAEALRQLYVALTRAKSRLYLPLGAEGSSFSLFGGDIESLKKQEGVMVIHPELNEEVKVEQALSFETIPPPLQLELPSSSPPLLSFSSIREKGHKVKTLANPGGTDFGIELHKIFATLSLEEIKQSKDEWVCKAYKTPLKTPWGTFCLQDVDEEKMLREGEFLFIDPERGVFTGFIDLVFEHLGKIFLVDWKTHLLPAYDRASLDEEMAIGDYTTQERLYKAALQAHIGPSFEDRFGGSFFLFVRGMDKSGQGVWYVN